MGKQNFVTIADLTKEKLLYLIQSAQEFEKQGMCLVGHHADSNIVEAVEIKEHPWFIGVQFHPEFQSKPYSPHPLFVGFIKAGINYKNTPINIENKG